jgi:hypothetical protein
LNRTTSPPGEMRTAPSPLHTSMKYSLKVLASSGNAESLAIEPGPKPITLIRPELDQLGLDIRDSHKIPLPETATEHEPLIDGIVSALKEALMRCKGSEEIWMAMNLRRAMILVGGLEEKTAREILDQEGA